jgi:hypothetical protein
MTRLISRAGANGNSRAPLPLVTSSEGREVGGPIPVSELRAQTKASVLLNAEQATARLRVMRSIEPRLADSADMPELISAELGPTLKRVVELSLVPL